MRRLLHILYGLAAYALGMATLAYLVAFTGNLLVAKTVDHGAGATFAPAWCVDLLLLALFGVQHSLMARRGFKQWWTRLVPPVVERSTYLVATCAVLWILFRLWSPIEAPLLWQIAQPWAVLLLWLLVVLGWSVVVVSSYLIDHFALFGLRQVFASPTGQPREDDRFATPLFYRHVRHPLYAGMVLGLWSAPVMTAGHALFAAGLTVYILIGIAFEERDLVQRFGDHYRSYRREVGMLVPLPRASRRPGDPGVQP